MSDFWRHVVLHSNSLDFIHVRLGGLTTTSAVPGAPGSSRGLTGSPQVRFVLLLQDLNT